VKIPKELCIPHVKKAYIFAVDKGNELTSFSEGM
jgi:hypothetical protein